MQTEVIATSRTHHLYTRFQHLTFDDFLTPSPLVSGTLILRGGKIIVSAASYRGNLHVHFDQSLSRSYLGKGDLLELTELDEWFTRTRRDTRLLSEDVVFVKRCVLAWDFDSPLLPVYDLSVPSHVLQSVEVKCPSLKVLATRAVTEAALTPTQALLTALSKGALSQELTLAVSDAANSCPRSGMALALARLIAFLPRRHLVVSDAELSAVSHVISCLEGLPYCVTLEMVGVEREGEAAANLLRSASQGTSLTTLSLTTCDVSWLADVLKEGSLPSLTKVLLKSCWFDEAERGRELVAALRSRQALTEVAFLDMNFGEGALVLTPLVKHLAALSSFSFASHQISTKDLSGLSHLSPCLTSLCIGMTPHLTLKGLKGLPSSAFHGLTHLQLHALDMKSLPLVHLAEVLVANAFPSLTHLALTATKGLSPLDVMSMVARLTTVTTLTLDDSFYPCAEGRFFTLGANETTAPHVTRLNLVRVANLWDWMPLRAFPSLVYLNAAPLLASFTHTGGEARTVGYQSIGQQAAYEELAHCPHLETLIIRGMWPYPLRGLPEAPSHPPMPKAVLFFYSGTPSLLFCGAKGAESLEVMGLVRTDSVVRHSLLPLAKLPSLKTLVLGLEGGITSMGQMSTSVETIFIHRLDYVYVHDLFLLLHCCKSALKRVVLRRDCFQFIEDTLHHDDLMERLHAAVERQKYTYSCFELHDYYEFLPIDLHAVDLVVPAHLETSVFVDTTTHMLEVFKASFPSVRFEFMTTDTCEECPFHEELAVILPWVEANPGMSQAY